MSQEPDNPHPQPLYPHPITLHAVATPTCKSRGEAAEAEFLARATRLDFPVAKPWGESRPYDFVLDSGRGFLRMQVKLATAYHRSQYLVTAHGAGVPYTKKDIDFLVAYIEPENFWYVVPIEAFAGVTMLHFNPRSTGKSKYEKYREAWCLLDCPSKARGRKDIPVRCRSQEIRNQIQCALCPLRK